MSVNYCETERADQAEAERDSLREVLRECRGEAHAIGSGDPDPEHMPAYQEMAHQIFHKASQALDEAGEK